MSKNYISEARAICIDGITKHKHFPKHMRAEAIAIIQSTFETLSKSIAAIELTELRKDKLPKP